jgi:hypothetical protein
MNNNNQFLQIKSKEGKYLYIPKKIKNQEILDKISQNTNLSKYYYSVLNHFVNCIILDNNIDPNFETLEEKINFIDLNDNFNGVVCKRKYCLDVYKETLCTHNVIRLKDPKFFNGIKENSIDENYIKKLIQYYRYFQIKVIVNYALENFIHSLNFIKKISSNISNCTVYFDQKEIIDDNLYDLLFNKNIILLIDEKYKFNKNILKNKKYLDYLSQLLKRKKNYVNNTFSRQILKKHDKNFFQTNLNLYNFNFSIKELKFLFEYYDKIYEIEDYLNGKFTKIKDIDDMYNMFILENKFKEFIKKKYIKIDMIFFGYNKFNAELMNTFAYNNNISWILLINKNKKEFMELIGNLENYSIINCQCENKCLC